VTSTIDTGTYFVNAPCPECGSIVEILANIASVLTVPQDDTPQLKVRLKAQAIAHNCRSGRQVSIEEAISEATR
jgi:hypothetical protein